MYCYVEIDANGIPFSMLRTHAKIEKDNIILVAMDFDWKNYKWDFETETWVEYIPEPSEPIEPEPTQLDRIESMIAKSQEEIAQEARDAYTLELIEGGVIA